MAESIPDQFQLVAEVEGVELVLDARRLRSMEFLRRVAAVQKNGAEDVQGLLELYDFMLGDPNKAVLESAIESRMGYVDSAAYLEDCNELLQEYGKN